MRIAFICSVWGEIVESQGIFGALLACHENLNSDSVEVPASVNATDNISTIQEEISIAIAERAKCWLRDLIFKLRFRPFLPTVLPF